MSSSQTPRESVTKSTSPRIAPPKLWDSRKPAGGSAKPAQNTREASAEGGHVIQRHV